MLEHQDLSWVRAAELARLARGDSPWHEYLNTKVHFHGAGVRGTLHPALTTQTVDVSGSRLEPLHVITAVQPGEDPRGAQSDVRLRILDDALRAAGLASIRAVGESLDDSYREEGRAVFGLDDTSARELGLRFGQVAIFAWNGPTWSLLACATDRREDRQWRWADDAE